MSLSYNRYNEDNVYLDPKKWGLTALVDEDIAGNWEFYIFATWYDEKKDGLWYAIDSGCSCPTPFSGFTKLEDLQFANNKEEIFSAIQKWVQDYNGESIDISSFRIKIREFFDKK